MSYVRNIPICSYTINKITFIINTVTNIIIIIIIIIIIFNFSITIIIIIIIISSSPLSLNAPLSSSSSVSFYISSTSEVCVSPSYLNSSVFFLTTCFLLFIGFSCNILLRNIYIDLLLLALVFLKNFSTFNKRYSKFIMCYNFNYRLVLDLYILFQSFRAVLITQKLGSNFKYQLHCIMACVIIITFNRFLNLKWLINLSSFIYSKLAYLTIKTCSKSSWALPINKYNLVKFFPSLFFIKFLVSIFKTIINFILRNFINVLLNCKYIFNIFKNEFLVLCIVYTIFTNVTNPCNIILIFYDYLSFCYFTNFGSLKFSHENFITSTLYFTKSVIYLRDITVSTKELFKVDLPC